MTPILTAVKGTNADLFPFILDLYVEPGSIVADTTFGRGVFWKNIPSDRYILLDTDLNRDGVDARHLPYQNGELDCVIFDPPYMHWSGSIKESINKCYNNNRPTMQYAHAERTGNGGIKKWQDVLELYRDASREALRVLRPQGILILKTQDTVACGKQRWFHAWLLELEGFLCEDLFVLMQSSIPAMDTKWKRQYHARKNHSFFIVHRKI